MNAPAHRPPPPPAPIGSSSRSLAVVSPAYSNDAREEAPSELRVIFDDENETDKKESSNSLLFSGIAASALAAIGISATWTAGPRVENQTPLVQIAATVNQSPVISVAETVPNPVPETVAEAVRDKATPNAQMTRLKNAINAWLEKNPELRGRVAEKTNSSVVLSLDETAFRSSRPEVKNSTKNSFKDLLDILRFSALPVRVTAGIQVTNEEYEPTRSGQSKLVLAANRAEALLAQFPVNEFAKRNIRVLATDTLGENAFPVRLIFSLD